VRRAVTALVALFVATSPAAATTPPESGLYAKDGDPGLWSIDVSSLQPFRVTGIGTPAGDTFRVVVEANPTLGASDAEKNMLATIAEAIGVDGAYPQQVTWTAAPNTTANCTLVVDACEGSSRVIPTTNGLDLSFSVSDPATSGSVVLRVQPDLGELARTVAVDAVVEFGMGDLGMAAEQATSMAVAFATEFPEPMAEVVEYAARGDDEQTRSALTNLMVLYGQWLVDGAVGAAISVSEAVLDKAVKATMVGTALEIGLFAVKETSKVFRILSQGEMGLADTTAAVTYTPNPGTPSPSACTDQMTAQQLADGYKCLALPFASSRARFVGDTPVAAARLVTRWGAASLTMQVPPLGAAAAGCGDIDCHASLEWFSAPFAVPGDASQTDFGITLGIAGHGEWGYAGRLGASPDPILGAGVVAGVCDVTDTDAVLCEWTDPNKVASDGWQPDVRGDPHFVAFPGRKRTLTGTQGVSPDLLTPQMFSTTWIQPGHTYAIGLGIQMDIYALFGPGDWIFQRLDLSALTGWVILR
jgi:hypothetical protein